MKDQLVQWGDKFFRHFDILKICNNLIDLIIMVLQCRNTNKQRKWRRKDDMYEISIMDGLIISFHCPSSASKATSCSIYA